MELRDKLFKVLNDNLKENFGEREPNLHETLDIQLQVQDFFMEFMEESTEFLKRFQEKD